MSITKEAIEAGARAAYLIIVGEPYASAEEGAQAKARELAQEVLEAARKDEAWRAR